MPRPSSPAALCRNVCVKSGAKVLKKRQDYDLEPGETFALLLGRVLDASPPADAVVSATMYPDSRGLVLSAPTSVT